MRSTFLSVTQKCWRRRVINDENKPDVENQAEKACKGSVKGQRNGLAQDVRQNVAKELRDHRRVLVDITVEIDDGHEEHMQFKEGDAPESLAAKFCHDHSLPKEIVGPLTEHICKHIAAAKHQNHFVAEKHQACNSHHSHGYGRKETSIEKRLHIKEDQEHQEYGSCTTSANARFNPTETEERSKFPSTAEISERLLSATSSSSKTTLNNHSRQHKRSSEFSKKEELFFSRLHAEYFSHNEKIEQVRKLYMEDYERKIKEMKPPVSKKARKKRRLREKLAKQYQNYGELLYEDSIHLEKKRQQLIELKQREHLETELKELTDKPEISEVAKKMKSHEKSVWDRLTRTGTRTRTQCRLRDLQNEAMELEMMECTFRPQISFYPKQVKEVDLQGRSCFDVLFLDAETRHKRSKESGQQYPEGFTFRPSINKKRLPPYASSLSGSNVFDRLLKYNDWLTQKKNEMKRNRQRLVDPMTGQEYFRPLIGRNPQARKAGVGPIGDFLYSLWSNKDHQRREQIQKFQEERKELAKGHYLTPHSELLLRKSTDKRLHKLFSDLDNDKDGYVSLADADRKHLSDELAIEIADVKKLGVDFSRPLDFQNFAELMISAQKKRKLLPSYTRAMRRQISQNRAFQLKINPVSRSLASRRGRFRSGRQWYKLILSENERRQAKVEALRKKRDEVEMAKCPFRPLTGSQRSKSHPLGSAKVALNKTFPSTEPIVEEREEDDIHSFIFQHDHSPFPHDHDLSGEEISADISDKEPTKSTFGLLNAFKSLVGNKHSKKPDEGFETPDGAEEGVDSSVVETPGDIDQDIDSSVVRTLGDTDEEIDSSAIQTDGDKSEFGQESDFTMSDIGSFEIFDDPYLSGFPEP